MSGQKIIDGLEEALGHATSTWRKTDLPSLISRGDEALARLSNPRGGLSDPSFIHDWLTDVLRHLRATPSAIKPLEWAETEEDIWIADTPFGSFVVKKQGKFGKAWTSLAPQGWRNYVGDDVEQIKQAHQHQYLLRIKACLSAAPQAPQPLLDAPRVSTDGEGWVFLNPDSGTEYSRNHPVESGEAPNAGNIRRSTSQEDVLWNAYQTQYQIVLSQSKDISRLSALKSGEKP